MREGRDQPGGLLELVEGVADLGEWQSLIGPNKAERPARPLTRLERRNSVDRTAPWRSDRDQLDRPVGQPGKPLYLPQQLLGLLGRLAAQRGKAGSLRQRENPAGGKLGKLAVEPFEPGQQPFPLFRVDRAFGPEQHQRRFSSSSTIRSAA